MIIFLCGQDTYRSRKELRRIIEDYKKANSDWFDFVRLDVLDKEIDFFEQVRKSADTISMFSAAKLIVVENIFSTNKEIQNDILEFLEKREIEKNKDINIVFWDEEPDQRSSLFKHLKIKARVEEFKPLKGGQLQEWIKGHITEQGGKTDKAAIDKLEEYIGSDLWRMKNEVDKLLDYNKTINRESIELLIKPEFDLNIFKMIDALGQKNKVKVLDLFGKYLEKGEDEFYLLSMFIYQVRNLLKVISGGRLDMHPFVAQKTKAQARNFNFEELKKIYRQLLTIDLDIKVGRMDSKTALELFLMKL